MHIHTHKHTHRYMHIYVHTYTCSLVNTVKAADSRICIWISWYFGEKENIKLSYPSKEIMSLHHIL